MFTIEFILQVILTALILYFAFNSYFHYQVYLKLPFAAFVFILIFYIILQLDKPYTLLDKIGLGVIAFISIGLFAYEKISSKYHLFFFCIDNNNHSKEIEVMREYLLVNSFSEEVAFKPLWKLGVQISNISYEHFNKMTNDLEKKLQKNPKKLAWRHLLIYVLTVLFVIVLWRF